MRNLKRALSLALAAVMLIGMMVVGAGAAYKDFTDQDEIQHKEAVQTLVSLNVINGKQDGSYYDPTGSLTRAEMAKLVVFILHGGVDPVLGTKGTPTYSDIKGTWAEAYIEYCSSVGIIGGDRAGKFNPEGTLTGSQAAKMLLVAMNYDATVFKFTGGSWEINVNREASSAGLYDGLEGMNASAVITRDDAALMVYNAIQANTMKLSWNQNWSTGEITQGYQPQGDSLLTSKFGAKTFIGSFDGNYNTGAASAKGEVLVTGRLTTDDGVATGQTDRPASFPSDLALSYIGEQVKVIFKDGTGGVDNKPDKKDTIYGVFNTGSTTVYNITKGDLQDAGSSNVADGKIKFGGSLYKMAKASAGTDVVIVNNYGLSTVNATGMGGTAAANLANYINTPANGLRVNSNDTIKFVCDEDGNIAKAYVLTTSTAEVTAVTSTNIQMAGQTSKKLEDCENADDLAKGDIARFASVYPTGNTVTSFLNEAEKVEGVIESFNSSSSAVKIDGVWYKYNGHNRFTVTDYTAAALTVSDVGNTVSLILDGEAYYGASKLVSGFNNYALVTATGSFLGTNSIKAMLADGTSSTYTNVEAADGGINFSVVETAVTTPDPDVPQLYAYALQSENTKIKLNAPAGKVSTTDTASGNFHKYVADNKTLIPVNNGTDTLGSALIVNPDAVVYLNNGTKWKSYAASELSSFSMTDNTLLQYILKDGKVVAFSAYVSSFPTASSTNTGFGYVTGYISTKVKDSPATELTIWNGTDSVTVYVDGISKAYKGDFVRYPLVSDGALIANSDLDLEGDVSGFTYTAAKVKSYDTANQLLITTTDTIGADGLVITGTDASYKLTANTVILGVKSVDKAGSTANTPVEYTKVFGSDYNNVVVVTEAKTGYAEVKAIFVDEDNKMYESTAGGTGTASGTAGAAITVIDYAGPITTLTASGASNNGTVAISATSDKATAVQGETVTVTLTISGSTATGAGYITIGGVTPVGTTVVTGAAGVTKSSDTKIQLPSVASSAATITFTYAMGASYVAPTFTFADGSAS